MGDRRGDGGLSQERVSVGVIGAGSFAQNNHIPCLLARPDVELAWVCDSNTSRLRKIKSMYGVEGVTTGNLEKRIMDADIVLIAVPYGVRDCYYNLCAEHDTAVYVEKPFARTLTEHDAIAALFPKQALTIGFNRRTYRNLWAVKTAFSEELFGALRRVAIRQGFFGLSGWSGFRSDAQLSGGGILIESGIHLIDTLIAITNPSAVNIEQCRMKIKEGIDYHTEALAVFSLSTTTIEVDIEISSVQNFASGIWFEFDRLILHYPILPDVPVTLRDAKNRLQGRLDLEVSGATSVAESLTLTWNDCIKVHRMASGSTITPADTRMTTEVLDKLVAEASS